MMVKQVLMIDIQDDNTIRVHNTKTDSEYYTGFTYWYNQIIWNIFYKKYTLWLLYRPVKFLIQRLVRGWSDDETWNIDSSFYKWAIPRLKRYKEISMVCPITYSENEWNNILDTIIIGFEMALHPDSVYVDLNYKNIKISKELFHTNIYRIWW